MNIQVTNGPRSSKARSESAVAIDPGNPQRMVAASKKFRDLSTYDFTIGTDYSTDGGQTWRSSREPGLLPGWTGITDPALVWDNAGKVFLLGLAFNSPPDIRMIGIYAYISTDGGASWSPPKLVHSSSGDDKQWIAADNSPGSPYYGRVYAAWDDVITGNIIFARTLDHGASWIGAGTQPPGSFVGTGFRYPEINVAPDGTLYIVGITTTEIGMFVSTNGGDSFHRVTSPAKDIVRLEESLPKPHGSPVFLCNGKFRVSTFPTASAGPGRKVVVAWADYRENVSRIYYALSTDGGASWLTGPRGQSILAIPWPADQQHFHPQIVFDSQGTIGCAFYEFGPKRGAGVEDKFLIDVYIAWLNEGETKFRMRKLTNQPWDPALSAPLARGNPDVTFIGDYFGLDAGPAGFYAVWTDTRRGTQELFAEFLYRPFRFTPVYRNEGRGIGNFDLLSPTDRAFAFDYASSGKQDHLVLYRPGAGAISILAKTPQGEFFPVYSQNDPGNGIGIFDLRSPADRAFAFDYDGSGKQDHLVLYRPGTGAIAILAHRGGEFPYVYATLPIGSGIGSYDLMSTTDCGFAYDFDGSGRQDYLAFYRPVLSRFWIIRRGGQFAPVFHEPVVGGFGLLSSSDRAFAFDYDSSGKPDHLVFYRPGTGTIWILKKTF